MSKSIREAAEALLSDIEAMAAGETDAGWFGGFEGLDGNGLTDSDMLIEWPNLRISADNLRKALDTPTKRFYVTMSWDDYPEGGTYGDVIQAATGEEAQQLCRQDMANLRADEWDTDDPEGNPQYWLDRYADEWHTIDCWDVDEFIHRHQKGIDDAVD